MTARSVTETVPAALAGERLDRVVSMVTGLSRARASELVDTGLVTVNGAASVSRSQRLAEGDEVTATVEEQAGPVLPAPDPSIELELVHVDDDVIVIDKPPGLVVHPGAGRPDGTLVNGLLARFPELAGVGDPERPGIVHRIDRDTSGLLMVARSPRAYTSLVGQLAARTVDRRYQALAWGAFDTPAGEIDGPIARSGRDPSRMTVATTGKPARTAYVVEHAFAEPVVATLLGCRLFTGRTHQIRVHLRAIGHPVVGDERYGGARQSFEVPRMFLHAATLGFAHPDGGEHLAFTSDLPDDLVSVLERLR